MSLALHYWMGDAQLCSGPHLRNDLYCVEWDVKLYYTILYCILDEIWQRCVVSCYSFAWAAPGQTTTTSFL